MWFLASLAFAGNDLPLPTRPNQGNPAVETGRETGPEPGAPAVAATLVFDCKVPAEILVDNVKLGQLWFPGVVTWKVAAGSHVARVYVGGTPSDHPLEVTPGAERTILVGRTGTTVSDTTSAPTAATTGPSHVGFRVIGAPAAQVRIDEHRELVEAGREYVIDLATGSHPLSLRNAEGTAIWSTGVLVVTGEGAVVVQVSEGRMPEVSGGAVFHSGG
jgi:hypothetical protein